MTMFLLYFLACAAGTVASVVGFGIGSLLTPALSLTIANAPGAVALVALPHFVGTLQRFWLTRHRLDKNLLFHFGIFSAAGGLCGALLHTWLDPRTVALIFSGVLLSTGFLGWSGLGAKLRFRPNMARAAGVLSGLLGGMVGNQGGIRAAAMLSFPVEKEAFIATATAVGLIVDVVRIPVYITQHSDLLRQQWALLGILSCGVVLGTAFGMKIMRNIPEQRFRVLVCVLITALGLYYLGKNL